MILSASPRCFHRSVNLSGFPTSFDRDDTGGVVEARLLSHSLWMVLFLSSTVVLIHAMTVAAKISLHANDSAELVGSIGVASIQGVLRVDGNPAFPSRALQQLQTKVDRRITITMVASAPGPPLLPLAQYLGVRREWCPTC